MTSKSSKSTVQLNYQNRMIWLMINIFFGGFISLIMMVWVSCDMEIPAFFFPILPSSFLHSIFHLRWIDMNLSLFFKILFNGCLFAVFGFVHTFFAQDNIQQYLTTKLSLPRSTLRTFYLVLTNIAVWLLMGLWQHTSIQLWDILRYFLSSNGFYRHSVLLILFTLINIPGACVVIQLDLLEFFGLKQIFQSTCCPIISRTTGMNKLVTNGWFQYCRHPMYLFFLIGFILSPCVSLDKCLFIIYSILYLYIAIPIEEKKLEKIFGQEYIDYKNRVPSIIPNFYKKKIV